MRVFPLILLVASAAACGPGALDSPPASGGGAGAPESAEAFEDPPPLQTASRRSADAFLSALHASGLDPASRLRRLAENRLGTPTRLFCLGEDAPPDTDPLFRLDVTDCSVFNMTNAALLNSSSLDEAREMILLANYRDPSAPSFATRLHFTTDRNDVSPLFSDLTEVLGGERVEVVPLTLNRRENGEPFILEPEVLEWSRDIDFTFIPSENLDEEFLDSLPPALGVAFVRRSYFRLGIDVAHEGLLLDGERVIHASSRPGAEEVREDPLLDLIERNHYDGITLFEFVDLSDTG